MPATTFVWGLPVPMVKWFTINPGERPRNARAGPRGEDMAHRDKIQIEENANRITSWLVEHSAEFEQSGLAEESVADAAKIPGDQATDAIDRLENREVLVRDPVALTK